MDGCKTRNGTKNCIIKQGPNTKPNKQWESNLKQWIKNNRITPLERTAAEATVYTSQIFAKNLASAKHESSTAHKN